MPRPGGILGSSSESEPLLSDQSVTPPEPAHPSGSEPTPEATASPLSPPVPPRSRRRRHALGLLLAVLLSPALLHLLASGAISVGEGDRGAGLAAFFAGGLIAGGLAWSARISAVGPALAGAVWTLTSLSLEIGLLSPVVLTNVLFVDLSTSSSADGAALLSGASWLGLVGGAALAGVVSIGGAGASSAARRRGIRTERTEADTVSAGDTRTPPRHRVGAHVTAVVIGLVASAVALVTASGIAHRVLGPPERSVFSSPAMILACLLLVALLLAVALSGALSSLGQASGAAVWLAAAVSTTAAGSSEAFWRVIEAILSPVTEMPEIAPSRLDIAGACLVVALTLAGGALGTHGSRREGRALERREQSLQRP